MHVVLLETSGNQSYIFATNKLRENVGASELTYRAGTDYVRRAIGTLTDVREVVVVSGKAILLVPTEKIGKEIVNGVTRIALEEAPGLDIRGVVGTAFDFASSPIHEMIKEAHRRLEQLRSQMPGPPARFQRLPVIAECDRMEGQHGPEAAI